MSSVGFEYMIPVFERTKRVHTSDLTATVIGRTPFYWIEFLSENLQGQITCETYGCMEVEY
jgi:hypothetical protein